MKLSASLRLCVDNLCVVLCALCVGTHAATVPGNVFPAGGIATLDTRAVDGAAWRVLDANDADGAAIAVTEDGLSNYRLGEATGDGRQATYAQQAAFIARMFLVARAAGAEFTCQFEFKDLNKDSSHREQNYGLLDYRGHPKPSYSAVAAMTRFVGDAEFDAELGGDPENLRIQRYVRADGTVIHVVWSVEGSQTYTIPSSSTLRADLRDAGTYDLYGNRMESPRNGDRLHLTEEPVYFVKGSASGDDFPWGPPWKNAASSQTGGANATCDANAEFIRQDGGRMVYIYRQSGSIVVTKGGSVDLLLVGGGEVLTNRTSSGLREIRIFRNGGTLSVAGHGMVDVLAVGGGGGGGRTNPSDGRFGGAGGGGGGVVYKTSFAVAGGRYPVVVGEGGPVGNGTVGNGGDTSVFGLVAYGGGAGARGASAGTGTGHKGKDGASGGGATQASDDSGTFIDGGSAIHDAEGNLGHAGGSTKHPWAPGGGGGAGAEGGIGEKGQPGKGGDGVEVPILAPWNYYGGGGAGLRPRVTNGRNDADGGLGGGGSSVEYVGQPGEDGLGGGGAGGARGGNGVVIVSVPVPAEATERGMFVGRGGDEEIPIDSAAGHEVVRIFRRSGRLTLSGSGRVDVLAVGGGGGGGATQGSGNTAHGGGGGGGGGVVYLPNLPVAADTYEIVVGEGGGVSTNGFPTSGLGVTAYGGGAGGNGSTATGKPVWGREVYVQPRYPGEVAALQNWAMVAHGVDVPLVFAWKPFSDRGREIFKKGPRSWEKSESPPMWFLIDTDGTRLPAYEAVKRSAAEIADFHATVDARQLRRIPGETALFWSEDTSVKIVYDTFDRPWETRLATDRTAITAGLRYRGARIEFLDDTMLGELTPERHPVCVVPPAPVISDTALVKLRAYAESGGRLLLFAPFNTLDVNLRPKAEDKTGTTGWTGDVRIVGDFPGRYDAHPHEPESYARWFDGFVRDAGIPRSAWWENDATYETGEERLKPGEGRPVVEVVVRSHSETGLRYAFVLNKGGDGSGRLCGPDFEGVKLRDALTGEPVAQAFALPAFGYRILEIVDDALTIQSEHQLSGATRFPRAESRGRGDGRRQIGASAPK